MKHKRRRLLGAMLGIAFTSLVASPGAEAGLKVGSLHPILSDLARNVGGSHVEVINLMGEGKDVHEFEPTPGDLRRVTDANLILASGKGLETYLGKLSASLGGKQPIYEVGKKLPSVKVEVGPLFVCCPSHSQGAIDPHWWHSVENMRRAARYLADEFGRLDPANAKSYEANADRYRDELAELSKWAKKEVGQIPRSQRKLATAHAAFGYFCKEFGFRAIPVQGLNRERDPSPAYLAETIGILKKEKVAAVFPERGANPKVLQAMVRETGVKTGGTLIADGDLGGDIASYVEMIRHNVSSIVKSLR